MKFLRVALGCGLALAAASAAQAQPAGGNDCIVAGRLAQARWAPRLPGVQLLGPEGRAMTRADKQTLSAVRQVRLSAPALLSRCDGEGELALGPDAPGPKERVPAIGPGVVPVVAVSFPKLRRGGELVELKLAVPVERVTMVTR